MPFTLAAVLWKTQWSAMVLGGGPPYSLAAQLWEAAARSVGGPPSGWGSIVAGSIAAAVAAFGLTRMTAHRLGAWIAVAMLLPILQVLTARPPFLFVRYFLVTVLLAQLALAVALSWLYRRGRWGRVIYACLLTGYVVANVLQTGHLIRMGRGQCRAALEFMASSTSVSPVRISSDHNAGIGTLVDFYAPSVRPADTFQYVEGQRWPREGPHWLVLHRDPGTRDDAPVPRLRIEGHEFRLTRQFACAPLSGWEWVCYRNQSLVFDQGASSSGR
jgi:hypothetical protein